MPHRYRIANRITHVFDLVPETKRRVFSRDCLELAIDRDESPRALQSLQEPAGGGGRIGRQTAVLAARTKTRGRGNRPHFGAKAHQPLGRRGPRYPAI
jgi:hypothetical protein